MLGITIGDKHSYKDFGLTIVSKNIGTPKKKKIKETVPFMNGTYDFSSIYGEQCYEERELTYKFNLISNSKIQLSMLNTLITNWLMNNFKTELYDDSIPGFYFMAECEEVDFDENRKDGILTVKFNSYPFKISTNYEGSDIWDIFNFELDYVQDTKFNVNRIKNIEIFNNSAIGVYPEVICDSDIYVTKNNIKYKFQKGTTKDFRFKLDKGYNNLTLEGNGAVEFLFKKEVL